jgi:hypothetical protein
MYRGNRFSRCSSTRLTSDVEVVGGDGVAKSGSGDEVADVEPNPATLQHRVSGAGDLPVGRLHPEQVRVTVRVRRVLCRRSGREPTYWACVFPRSNRVVSAGTMYMYIKFPKLKYG